MKLPHKKRDETSATIVQTLWLILVCSGLCALTAYAADPSWWSSPGTGSQSAVNTNNAPNDYAVVTQGQLKQFTARAVDELNTRLASYGGAGTDLNTMVGIWASDYTTQGYNATDIKPSDYAAMNVGQLKYIGNKVWVQLVAAGYTNAAPSCLQQNANSDNVVANLGQLKEIFNFDLTLDSDNNGLPDWWEMHYFEHIGNDPGSRLDGNGFTLWEDYLGGADPNNYYSRPGANGPVTIVPALNITGGNNQTSLAGHFAPQPLMVQVTDSSSNNLLVNAPVTFTVTVGGGQLAADLFSAPGTSLPTTTDGNGNVQVYFLQPTDNNVTSTITASTDGQSVSQSFTEISAGDMGFPTAGLALWLRADEGVTTDGSNWDGLGWDGTVSSWSDQTGFNTVTGAGSWSGSEPTEVTGALNGLPVLRFNGSEWLSGSNLVANSPTIITVGMAQGDAQYTINTSYGTSTNGAINIVWPGIMIGSGWSGNLAEVLVYNRQLSTTELQQVAGHLADKYGLYDPNATWPQAYTSDVQSLITAHQLSKAQADAYVAFEAGNQPVPTAGLTAWFSGNSGVTTYTNSNGLSGTVSTWTDRTGIYTVSQNQGSSFSWPPFSYALNDSHGNSAVEFSGEGLSSTSPVTGLTGTTTIITVGCNEFYEYEPYTINLSNDTSGANGAINVSSSGITFGPTNWSGGIAEVLVYNRTLTTTELQLVGAYLGDKYGLYNPNAGWVQAYTDTTFRGLINTHHWNKDQADAYATFLTSTQPVPTIGLTLWLSADSGTTTDWQLGSSYWGDSPSGGGRVNGWADRTGINKLMAWNHYWDPPTYVTNDVNGHPAVRYNGSQWLHTSGNIGTDLNAEMTVITVARTTSLNDQQYAVSLGEGIPDQGRAFGYELGSQLFDASNDDALGAPAQSSNTFVAEMATLDTNKNVVFYRNGYQEATGTLSNPQTVTAGITIGAMGWQPASGPPPWGGQQYGWQGDIAEVLVYDHKLSSDDMTQINDYLTTKYGLNVDFDHNGLPDWWELQYLGQTGNDSNSSPDGNGNSLIDDYTFGADPSNYYSQIDWLIGKPFLIAPAFSMISGNSQLSSPGEFTDQPLIVSVTDSNGNPLVNAPVQFTVTAGGGQVATTSGGTTHPSLLVRTDANGLAQIYYQNPASLNVTSTITATTAGQSETFTESSSTGDGTFDAPSDLASTSPSPTEIDLTWVNHASTATFIEVRASPDGVNWTTIATLNDPTTTSYAVKDLVNGANYNFYVRGGK